MSSVDKFSLSSETINLIKKVLSQYASVEKVIVYGSRAKGNYREGSDIDLCLVGEGLSLSELLKIENELDDLMLPYKIDLVLEHQIDNPDLKDHINRVGQIFF